MYNAGSFYACTKDRNSIKIDGIEISDFVDEDTLLKLIEGDFNIESVPSGFSLSRADLLTKFKKANDLLRKAGLREGYERFSVFSDLMFLKLKNDFGDIGELSGTDGLDKSCTWKKLIDKIPSDDEANFDIEDSEVKSYLEDTIKKKLKEAYGDVFESSLNIQDEIILIDLIKLIDSIPLKDVDTDVKGDAFEYFLRNVTNGNKDLGEYYTPRHIVKMIVKLLNPIYGEKIYDPCCGTGGFLLECFKHLRNNTDVTESKSDSNDVKEEKKEKRRIIREESVYGREITSTARIAKMNMILFGDGHTHIRQMDSLSEVVKEEFNIVVSNIPYSQKVENGAFYEFPTEKGDSLFMQHIWKAVKKGGRIAVVVPDTFLYGKDTFDIRKKIIDESLRIIIVSLPRGVFNPYTPTKTSILFAYKKQNLSQSSKQTDISMYIIRNDGFELGARRRPLRGQSDCNKFLRDYDFDKNLRIVEAPNSINVSYDDILKKKYNLFPFEYMEHLPSVDNLESLKSIGSYIEERKERFDINIFDDILEECVILSVTKNGIYIGDELSAKDINDLKQKYKRVYAGDFTYNPHRINVGSVGVVPQLSKYMYVSDIYPVFKIKDTNTIPNYYLQRLLKTNEYKVIINDYCQGGARADLKLKWLSRIKLELPSEDEIKRVSNLSQKMEKVYNLYRKLLKELMEE